MKLQCGGGRLLVMELYEKTAISETFHQMMGKCHIQNNFK
jgi:hypothetical protein